MDARRRLGAVQVLQARGLGARAWAEVRHVATRKGSSRGRVDLGIVMEGAQQRVKPALDLPQGYWIVRGGQDESLRSARARLSVAIPAVLGLILLLLWALFARLRPTLIILPRYRSPL